MVSFVRSERGFESVPERGRKSCASPPAESSRAVNSSRQPARHRKQKCMSKMSDSGFEEDLVSSATLCGFRTDVSHNGSNKPELVAGHLSSWYLQYGDVGFKIQREKEEEFHPCKSLAHQPQLTAGARCKLISWLIPVHKHFRLSFECCCLTVTILDRFLASTPIAADCFQLLGVTALLLASKQVEVCSPPVSHLLSMCCDAFTKEQLCNLECLILLRLNFRLAAPTLAFFLDYYTNCIEAAHLVIENNSSMFPDVNPGTASIRQQSNLAQKVCELTLADYAFNKYPPSLTASCALTLASELLKTDRGFTENVARQSKEDQWASFADELCTQPASVPPPADSGSDSDSGAVKRDFLSEGEVNYYNCSLVQECKENLKLLVSLNQETLEVRSNL
ncbi:LOW QUALITY PROTEIN: cyclin-O [Odontesthes bonariensis]|uniref:LOW QUALITY PROTEIN: cyclin-O n=1 Tax=Odontesthes bonariensis TaxID=219752 RepID=UPI003F582C95